MSEPTGPSAGGGVPTGAGAVGAVRLFALVNALTGLPSLSDEAGRSTLTRMLPPAIAASVSHDPRPKIHLFNLVRACLEHEDGMAQVLAALRLMEGDSLPMRHALLAAMDLTGPPGKTRGDGGE